jgi:pimeloyl-ACP methyl ester carboxylesterase
VQFPGHVVTFTVTALVLFLAGSTWVALFPGVPIDLGGAPNLDARCERVRVPVGGADHLDAWLLRGRGRGTVVVFHGFGRDHHRAWRYAQFLNRAGWTVLAPDFRSSRIADRKPTTLGHFECEDARATLDWVAGRPELRGTPLVLFGESLGGSVALAVAADRPEVKAVIVDCPFESGTRALEDAFERWAHVPRWPATPIAGALAEGLTGHDPRGLDVLAAARRLNGRPVFFIACERDDRLSVGQTRNLWNAAGARDSLWVLGDCGHTEAWQMHRREYERRVLAFLAASVPAPKLHADAPRRPATGVVPSGRATHVHTSASAS